MPIQPLTRNLWRLTAVGLWLGAIACGASSPPSSNAPLADAPAPAEVAAPPPGPPAPTRRCLSGVTGS
ncbi:MAG: hypothetical protein HC812_12380 [Leptolyngbya sp. RL_3_1]|nr:hypothetical protein [Leptolyngbya sp. RL_3_1]